MNEIIIKNTDFSDVYNKSHRLAAAVFLICNIIDRDEELKTKIKNLALNLVSMSVKLKDINFSGADKLTADLERNSLELMSMLDIASISGLISKMNANILKEEFQLFISELNKFSEKFESSKNISVKGLFKQLETSETNTDANYKLSDYGNKINLTGYKTGQTNSKETLQKNGNDHKRKDMRKSAVLEFIKGHNNASIKDIMPNITGCSEKTVQRELISLINDGLIKKTGERRWSKYSIIQ